MAIAAMRNHFYSVSALFNPFLLERRNAGLANRDLSSCNLSLYFPSAKTARECRNDDDDRDCTLAFRCYEEPDFHSSYHVAGRSVYTLFKLLLVSDMEYVPLATFSNSSKPEEFRCFADKKPWWVGSGLTTSVPLSGEGVVSSYSVVATGLVSRHGVEFGTFRVCRFAGLRPAALSIVGAQKSLQNGI